MIIGKVDKNKPCKSISLGCLHQKPSALLSLIFQLPPAQECTDDTLNYCGGDEEKDKYPEDTIADVLKNNDNLKTAVLTLRKFFQSEVVEQENEIIDLDKLACKATRQKIPRYSRAKDVNGLIILLEL